MNLSSLRRCLLAMVLVFTGAFIFALAEVDAEYEEVEHSKAITTSEVPQQEQVFGKLTIKKVDQFGQPVEGVEFTLTSTRGSEIVLVGTTDDLGELVFDDIRVGFYQLVETNTPEGYLNSDEVITVVITKKTTEQVIEVINEKVEEPKVEIPEVEEPEVEIPEVEEPEVEIPEVEEPEVEIPEVEEPKEFEVILTKKDSVTEERLAGVAFDVYYEGELLYSSVLTDENGEIMFTGIAGEYRFVEVQALEGYDFDENNEYIVNVVDSDEEITVYNNKLVELEVNIPEEPVVEEPEVEIPVVEEPVKEIIDVLPATGHIDISLILGLLLILMGLALNVISSKEEKLDAGLAVANHNRISFKNKFKGMEKASNFVEIKNFIGIYTINKKEIIRYIKYRE